MFTQANVESPRALVPVWTTPRGRSFKKSATTIPPRMPDFQFRKSADPCKGTRRGVVRHPRGNGFSRG